MLIKGRWRAALILCLLWAIALATSFYLVSEAYGREASSGQDFWIIALFSLFILLIGMVAFFGRIRVFFFLSYPLILVASEIDTSKYDIEKASFALGILTATLSYVFLFIPIGGLIVVVALCVTAIAFVIGIIYVFAAKRFRADPQPKH